MEGDVIGIVTSMRAARGIVKRGADESEEISPVELKIGVLETVIGAVRVVEEHAAQLPGQGVLRMKERECVARALDVAAALIFRNPVGQRPIMMSIAWITADGEFLAAARKGNKTA